MAGYQCDADGSDPATHRVGERLETEGMLGNAGDAEILRDRPSSQDELVVGDRRAVGEFPDPAVGVDTGDLTEANVPTHAPAQDGPEADADVLGLQDRGCDLVEQWLEGVMVAPIHERDAKGGRPPPCREFADEGEPAEPTTDHDHVSRW